MNRINIKKEGKKISINKSQQQLDKETREQRIKQAKSNKNHKIEDIMAMLNDMADRQSEIYDMIKSLRK